MTYPVDRTPLPTSTPAAQGVAAGAIIEFLDVLEESSRIEPHSIMVLRHGRVIAAGWWAPFTRDRRHHLFSLSKSFTATAAALAVGAGVVRADEPVIDYFPELAGEITDPRARSIRVRHLAALATGHPGETWDKAIANDRDDPVRGFLSLPPTYDPGSVFAYNQSATYTLATLVARRTGRAMSDHLNDELLPRIGADEIRSEQHPAGSDLGFMGTYATTGTIARLGQLYLQGGRWNGEQLLPPDWVADATRPAVRTAPGPDVPTAALGPDWEFGYGYQFWMSRRGYRGEGLYGQFCVVVPELDTVIAMTAGTPIDAMQSQLDAIWNHLLPGYGSTPLPPTDADRRLADRLRHLRIDPVPGTANPTNQSRWATTTFTPRDLDRVRPRSLSSMTLRPTQDGWRVTLTDAGDDITATFRDNAWETSEPGSASRDSVVANACSGGWLDDDTLRFDVLFLETPHRLHVTCTRSDGTFAARWTAPPWQRPDMPHPARLRDLHAPARPESR